ncbi:MAG TPA: AIR carboxylase family protein, partial [Pirellulales bacterium]|nr:AIR carboxylase family protein [Pirellulales bacterium]
PHECRIVSAHRTPDWLAEYARTAESRGLEVIVAGAGGAAHLPGMAAALATDPKPSQTARDCRGAPLEPQSRRRTISNFKLRRYLSRRPWQLGILACTI